MPPFNFGRLRRRRPLNGSFWLLLTSLTLSASASLLAQDAASADALQQQGQKLYRDGNLDGAVAAFRKAAALRPNDPNLASILGQALADQGSWQEAEAAY